MDLIALHIDPFIIVLVAFAAFILWALIGRQKSDGPMWYPNRAQWVVIWISSLLALAIWILNTNWQDERLATGIVCVGALLVWQLSRPRSEGTAPASVAPTVPDRAKPEQTEDRRLNASAFERLQSYCQDKGLKLDKITGGYAVLAPSSMDPYSDQWIKKDLQNRFHAKVSGESHGSGSSGWRRVGVVESREGSEG